MRGLIAEIGGFDFAVSEFIRVSREVIRAKAILKEVPELAGKPIGRALMPVQVQLLGSNPELLSATAVEACLAGAKAIDLNFGCPSPTVIRRNGGSALLREPDAIRRIVEAVRKEVTSIISVSAKIRLGWTSPDEVFDIATAARDGGVSWITIHGRTRAELYRPGVHWEQIARLNQTLGIPIIANGDLFSIEALKTCRSTTHCEHFMLGRGVLVDPFLGRKCSEALGIERQPSLISDANEFDQYSSFLSAIRRFLAISDACMGTKRYALARTKQWIGLIRHLANDRVPVKLMRSIGKARSIEELLALLELNVRI